MTYVEFYDRNSIENICACLSMKADEVILIGNDETALQKHMDIYHEIFKNRDREIKFSYETVSNWKIQEVLNVLENILKTHKDCVFGITGGDELVVFALGILCERYRDTEEKVQVHKISIQENKIYDCDMDGEHAKFHSPFLSVKENIRIYGGIVEEDDNVHGEKTYKWNMTHEFEKDIEDMWSICKVKPDKWNRQINVFDALSKVGNLSADGCTLIGNASDVEAYCRSNHWAYVLNTEVRRQLQEAELITGFNKSGEQITVKFKSPQVKRCLTQAGLALEMKVYKMARNITQNIDGKEVPLYNDVVNGVEIDWDGIIPEEGDDYDTTNEIDVMLMHNMVPVFVSCKNGNFTQDEFYKLNTVANRFGGKYTKMVLAATMLEHSNYDELRRERAENMGIKIIDRADLLDDNLLVQKLEEAWQ